MATEGVEDSEPGSDSGGEPSDETTDAAPAATTTEAAPVETTTDAAPVETTTELPATTTAPSTTTTAPSTTTTEPTTTTTAPSTTTTAPSTTTTAPSTTTTTAPSTTTTAPSTTTTGPSTTTTAPSTTSTAPSTTTTAPSTTTTAPSTTTTAPSTTTTAPGELRISSFSVDPSEAASGDDVTLTWQIDGWAPGMTAALKSEVEGHPELSMGGDVTSDTGSTGAGTRQFKLEAPPGAIRYTLTVAPPDGDPVSAATDLTVIAADPVAISDFEVSPTSVPSTGGEVTFSWQIDNWQDGMTVSLQAQMDGKPAAGGDVTANTDSSGQGSFKHVVKGPAGTLVYTLTVAPQAGVEVLAEASLEIQPVNVMVMFYFDPPEVVAGEPVTARWEIHGWDPDTMTLSLQGKGSGGDVTQQTDASGVGSHQLRAHPDAAEGKEIWVLQLRESDGGQDQVASFMVHARPPRIASFEFDEPEIPAGEPAVARWIITNWDPTTMTVSLVSESGAGGDATSDTDENGNGMHTLRGGLDARPGPETWTLQVARASDGASDVAQAQFTVKPSGSPSIKGFAFDPPSVKAGDPVTAVWKVDSWIPGAMKAALASESGSGGDVTAETDDAGNGTHQLQGHVDASGAQKWSLMVTREADGVTLTADAQFEVLPPDAPAIEMFRGYPVEGHSLGQATDSLQIERGHSVVLAWQARFAEGVELTDPGAGAMRFDMPEGSTEVTPQAAEQDYRVVAVHGTQRSDVSVVHVSTHEPGAVVSPHAKVTS